MEISPDTDLNNVTSPGLYFCGAGLTVSNAPPNPMSETACSVLVEKTYALGIKQKLSWYFTGQSYYRTFDGESWHDWVPDATATPPQEYDLPLAEGATSVGSDYKNTYSKDQFGIVRVWFSIHFETIPEVNQIVFSLPEGFKPSARCCGSAFLSMGAYYPASINIDVYGNGSVGYGSITHSGAINLHGFIEFPTIS